MVLTNRSQIPQFTKRFFYQSWPFKCFQNTTFGINKFFNFRFEITIYNHKQNQKNQSSVQLNWRYI